MKKRLLKSAALACACLCLELSAAPAETVFHDDFSAMKPEMISAGVLGAEAEYHYYPSLAPHGNWEVATFRNEESQRAWRVIRENGFGRQLMYQAHKASASESAYTHPLLVTGDPLWTDYTATVKFAPESTANWSGFAVRYHNNRCLYFFGVKDGQAYLLLLNHGSAYRVSTVTTLAQKPCAYKAGEYLTATVQVQGKHFRAAVLDTVLEADDATFTQGRVALMADVPTRYAEVTVTMAPEAKASVTQKIAARAQKEAELQAANPKMVLWKKMSTVGFGTGRSVRFGDLDGDGQLDVLIAQVNNHGPKDRNSEVGCLTAMTFDGKILWQTGEEDLWRDRLTCDVAVQIHDLDHDGKNEVIYCRDMELVIAEGATGKVLRKIPTPLSPKSTKKKEKGETQNKYPHILGDSLYFLDLRGQGWAGDIILKDRYTHLWAYTDKLEPLWDVGCNTGHYGYAYDIDGDGKDEFMIGYNLISHDGKILWSLDDQIKDHADAVAILKFHPDDKEPSLFCAASDEGAFWTDLKGNVLKRLFLGHVQSPSIANYRDDLPGLETVSVNFHGNQGILNFYDAKRNVYLDTEPMHHGSMMLPLNWTGKSEELIVVSPNVDEGVYDGWGRQVLKFPADGHPEMCYDVLDITGDCRDEIVVWDAQEMWVYTQSDNPKPGRLYKPKRNPLYNRSNYQATVSLPGWSQ